jgi:hypothetical protein
MHVHVPSESLLKMIDLKCGLPSKTWGENEPEGCFHLPGTVASRLFSNSELLDQCSILPDIFSLDVIKKASSLTNESQETLSGVMILYMLCKVTLKIFNSGSNGSNLNMC